MVIDVDLENFFGCVNHDILVDRSLQQRGHLFARYADACNVYVRTHKAGESVLCWMRKMYEKLHLRVNEKKTEVGPVFGHKSLGYCLRRWSG